ncbi:Pili assembly chaperone [Enterobacter kobei]|nr:Pili assembly chaperone [Enterobacter kobei]
MTQQWRSITVFVMLMAAGISSVLAIPSNTDTSLSGVGTDRTRYVFKEGTRQIGLTLKNKTRESYLVQAWVRGIDPKTGDVVNEQTPFFLKQPLVKTVAGGRYGFQLIKTKPVQVQDRESLYLLSFKFIPSKEKETKKRPDYGQTDVVLTYNVKLFYRPATLKDSRVAQAAALLKFHRQGSVLKVNNPGPLWITFYSLKAGGYNVPEESFRQMVPPFGEADYTIPENTGGNHLTWRVIDENGDPTRENSAVF